jgi:predicted AAA+ superfamily ATPase
MFDRIVSPTVQAAARSFPVVAIVGARQVGKTTLA